MFNNNFEFHILKIIKYENGNKLIIDITIEGKRLTLINIYGPNRDNTDIYYKILTYVKQTTNPVILAGDFDLILDPAIDTKHYQNINNPKAREQVLNLITEYNLIDSWRELNLETS